MDFIILIKNIFIIYLTSHFQEAIVFMVGGGNYIEYQNLMELAQSKGGGGISSPSGASVSLLSPGTHHPLVPVVQPCCLSPHVATRDLNVATGSSSEMRFYC